MEMNGDRGFLSHQKSFGLLIPQLSLLLKTWLMAFVNSKRRTSNTTRQKSFGARYCLCLSIYRRSAYSTVNGEQLCLLNFSPV